MGVNESSGWFCGCCLLAGILGSGERIDRWMGESGGSGQHCGDEDCGDECCGGECC